MEDFKKCLEFCIFHLQISISFVSGDGNKEVPSV